MASVPSSAKRWTRASITFAEEGLVRRQVQWVIFVRCLLRTLRRCELDDVVTKLAAETGHAHRTSAEGNHVASTYRRRVTLTSGRFGMIDDGLRFQWVPWRHSRTLSTGRLN